MPITPQEFANQMTQIALRGDPEAAHGDADDLLCETLKELGYYEGVKIFESMDKWYA